MLCLHYSVHLGEAQQEGRHLQRIALNGSQRGAGALTQEGRQLRDFHGLQIFEEPVRQGGHLFIVPPPHCAPPPVIPRDFRVLLLHPRDQFVPVGFRVQGLVIRVEALGGKCPPRLTHEPDPVNWAVDRVRFVGETHLLVRTGTLTRTVDYDPFTESHVAPRN